MDILQEIKLCNLAFHGSVLGSFLFLLYFNDFQNASEFEIAPFADDILLRLSTKNFLGFEKCANKSLDQISQ